MIYLLILIIFSAGFWLIFNDTFVWLVNTWANDPFYSHGFIVLFLCVLLVVLNGLKIRISGVYFRRSVFWWVCSIVLVSAGNIFRFHYLTALSYVFFCVAVTELLVMPETGKYVKLPLFVLLLIFPVPFLNEIAGFLSFTSSAAAVPVLKLFFPALVVNGIDITIPPDVRFVIGANCGGAGSVLALLTVTVVWLVVVKNGLAANILLPVLAVPIGFLTNVSRIVCIFIIAKFAGMEPACRLWHGFSGYFFYIASISAVFCVWFVFFKMNKESFSLRRMILK